MPIEYAIWGIPPEQTEETLLFAMLNGKPITNKAVAERLALLAQTRFKATAVRIQVVDLSTPPAVRKRTVPDFGPSILNLRSVCDTCGKPAGGTFAAAGVYCSEACAAAAHKGQVSA